MANTVWTRAFQFPSRLQPMYSLKATATSAAALALLATCGLLLAPSLASAASSGFIEGTVTDAATHQPLKEINVCA